MVSETSRAFGSFRVFHDLSGFFLAFRFTFAGHLQLSLAPVPLPRDAEKKARKALESEKKQRAAALARSHGENPENPEKLMICKSDL